MCLDKLIEGKSAGKVACKILRGDVNCKEILIID